MSKHATSAFVRFITKSDLPARRAQYEMEMGDANPMRDKLQTGQPIYCYATFGDNWQFQGARWSFHPRPPSEEEAAAEVSVLEPLNCPALWTYVL